MPFDDTSVTGVSPESPLSRFRRFALLWPDRVGVACGSVVRRVAQWPFTAIGICLLAMSLASLGWLRVEIVTDQAAVWNAADSPFAVNERRYGALFGPMYMFTSVILSARNATDNVLSRDGLWEVELVRRAMFRVEVFSAHLQRNVSLADFCLKPVADGPCFVTSVMDYFANDWAQVESRADRLARTVSLSAEHPLGVPISRSSVLGGIEYLPMSTVVKAVRGFKIEAILNTSFAEFAGPERLNPLLVAWNAELLALLAHMRRNGSLTLLDATLGSDDQPEVEIAAVLSAQIPTLLIGIGLILLFVVVNLGQCSPRCETRIGIGISTAVAVGFCISTSLALPAAIGAIPVTSVTAQVVPMLAFSIAVDNVFIVVKSFYTKRERLRAAGMARQTIDLDAIASTYVDTGPSILSTACTMFAVFLISGFLSESPAVAYLSYQVAFAMVANLIIQFVALPSVCVIDARLRDCGEPADAVAEPKAPRQTPQAAAVRRVGARFRGLGHWYASLLLYLSGTRRRQAIVLGVALALCGAALAMAVQLNTNFDLVDYFPADGNMRRFLNSRQQLFPNTSTIPFFVVTSGADYASLDIQEEMEALTDDLKGPALALYSDSNAIQSWHRNMRSWLTFRAHTAEFQRNKLTVPPPVFDQWTREFVESLGAAHSIDIVWRRPSDGAISPAGRRLQDLDASWANATVHASRLWGLFNPLPRTDDFLGAIEATESVASKHASKLHTFSFSPFYPYLWQFVGLRGTLALNIAACLLVVFLITLAFSCNLPTAILVLIVQTAIVIDILGLLWLFGISLNAIALLITASAISIGAEYFNYVVGAYQTVGGDDPRHRLQRVGSSTAVYLLLAAASSVVGMTVLLFDGVPLVRLYFGAPWFLIVIVCALHALIVLPVLLSTPFFAAHLGKRAASIKQSSAPIDDAEYQTTTSEASEEVNEVE
jgi:Niemann-Pick C1 protein